MLPVGFKATIPASAWPKARALDRAATGIGTFQHESQIRPCARRKTYEGEWRRHTTHS
jgi:hypothetical protein